MFEDIKAKMTGLQAILVTPFLENGDVDYDGIAQNVEKLIAAGVKWLTCTGHCGEFASLTFDEYVMVIKTVCQTAKGTDAIVVPGVSAHSLRTHIMLSNEAEKAGASAMLTAPPFYAPCKLPAAKAYFTELSKNCGLPMQLYYFPQLHRMELGTAELVELLSIGCFAAIKETSRLDSFTLLCALVGDKINVITGSGEYLAPDLLIAGGKGFISTTANYWPEGPLAMARAIIAGDYMAAARMRHAMAPFLTACERCGSIDTIKKLMTAFGYRGGSVRLPELPSISKQSELDELIVELNKLKENEVFRY